MGGFTEPQGAHQHQKESRLFPSPGLRTHSIKAGEAAVRRRLRLSLASLGRMLNQKQVGSSRTPAEPASAASVGIELISLPSPAHLTQSRCSSSTHSNPSVSVDPLWTDSAQRTPKSASAASAGNLSRRSTFEPAVMATIRHDWTQVQQFDPAADETSSASAVSGCSEPRRQHHQHQLELLFHLSSFNQQQAASLYARPISGFAACSDSTQSLNEIQLSAEPASSASTRNPFSLSLASLGL